MFNFNYAEVFSNMESQLLEKARNMEKMTDPKDIDKPIAQNVDVPEDNQEGSENSDLPKNLDPNTVYEIDGNYYETDDNGNIYKTNGELNPNTEYTVNGITYKTDSQGRIVSWKGEPGYNPEAERDGEAQTDAGGEDRQDGDDGGHLVARVLDGSPGNENIVPMRDTVNRGDYKKSENEIAKAKQEGKDVQDSGNIIYEGDSSRPSKIERTYTIDGEKRELKVDNVEGSQDLLEDVKDDISEDDYESLEERIEDMEADGSEVSVTSVSKKYDSEGNLVSVTVGLRDETNGNKTYITYNAK
ncbi:DNA/RNA non-specific endonuclease [Kandleria vitulina]|uniref:DNA/RNA non-specific endonuclease n=1 Tax=Kandleria vitulina TaxID=1630 RepID=UPI000685A591|nr:DNA/RNA non-specific endonuclease [Kandleria vitulina]